MYFPDNPRGFLKHSFKNEKNHLVYHRHLTHLEMCGFHWRVMKKKSLRKLVTEAVRQMFWKENYNICLKDDK